MTPEIMTTPPTLNTDPRNSRRMGWQRWFQLVWLVFLLFPALELFGKPRLWPEYAFGALVFAGFVVVFIWCFFLVPWGAAVA
jgi:hypothetical protein